MSSGRGVLVLLKFDLCVVHLLKYFEFHILWSLSSVDFHTLTLQLPIQTPNYVEPELQAFVSSLAISAKRAHPREIHCPIDRSAIR